MSVVVRRRVGLRHIYFLSTLAIENTMQDW
jgi:hypothetical protein